MNDPSPSRPASQLHQSSTNPASQPASGGAVIAEKPLTCAALLHCELHLTLFSAESSSYLNTVGGYLADAGDFMSGYVPSALRKTLPSWSSAQAAPEEERERPTWSGFDQYELPSGERRQVLCAAYSTGFQVWDINEGHGDMRELLSRREPYPIKGIRFLPQPAAKELAHHPFYGRRPMLVVLSSDDNPTSAFANSMMKVYSAANGEYANMVKFSAEIMGVQASRRIVVVLLRAQLHAFDAVTMEQLFSFRTFPFANPLLAPSISCATLGARFLAFASRDPPPAGAASAPNASALKDAASTVASGLAYLGEQGRRRVAELLYATPQYNDPGVHFSPPEDSALGVETDAAGTVQVLDVVSRRVVAHFKAHTQPMSGMSWDPSGSLLLTVSNEAHHFHVWLITPTSTSISSGISPSSPATHTHLYKLVRGVTGAAVQSLCWSRDSRWLAVSSGRGTTHVFALHPQGGVPSTNTHASDALLDANGEHIAPGAPLAKPFANLSALARLKPQRSASAASAAAANSATAPVIGGAWDEDEALVPIAGKSAAPPPFPVSTALLPSGQLLLHGDGQLTRFNVAAHGPAANSELDPRTLCVDLLAGAHWDLARRRAWPELKALPAGSPKLNGHAGQPSTLPVSVGSPEYNLAPPPPANAIPAGAQSISGPGESSATLWAEVELHTHAPPFRPLWAGPQCSLRGTDMVEYLAPLSLLSASATAPVLSAPIASLSPPSTSTPAPALPVVPAPAHPPVSHSQLPIEKHLLANVSQLPLPASAPIAAPVSSLSPNSFSSVAPAVSVSPPVSSNDSAPASAGGRRKDKKKNNKAAAVAAASSPSPPPPQPVAPASPSMLRLDEPTPRSELPLMKDVPLHTRSGSGNDVRVQGIMSAISTPLMAPQQQQQQQQHQHPASQSAWSPGSSPLAPPVMEFLRPAQRP